MRVAELPSVQHHLAKARVVSSRGYQPGSAGEQFLGPAVRIIGRIGERSFGDWCLRKAIKALVRIVGVGRCHSLPLVIRRIEIRVLHTQWFEDASAEKFVEGPSGNNFHQPPQYIYPQAVFPMITRTK